MKVDKASIARYAVLVVAVINAVANLIGYQTIPDETTNDIVAALSAVVFLYTGWKNNYLTSKGKQQKEVLKRHDLN